MTNVLQNRLRWQYILIIPVALIMGFYFPAGALEWLAISTARVFLLVP